MNFVSLWNIVNPFVLGLAGVFGGAIITAKLVDGVAAVAVLTAGGLWLGTCVLSLIALYQLSQRTVVAYPCFAAMAVITGPATMLFGLSLPLFALYGPTTAIGKALIGYFIFALFYQLWRIHPVFVDTWMRRKEQLLAKFYDRRASTLMVLSLSSNLRIDVDLFLPVRSEFLKGVVAVVLVLSMIVGLNLRRLFPKFSAFAWGIPSLTMLTVLLQMCFVGFLLAFEFWKIQTGSGRLIAPDRRDSGLTRIKWNRKKKRH